MVKTCEESIKKILDTCDPNLAKGINGSFLFDIGGENGGKWSLVLNDGNSKLVEGSIDNPTVTISVNDSDWLEIFNGNLNSQMAFMMGKLRVSGDMGLAMKLQSLIPSNS